MAASTLAAAAGADAAFMGYAASFDTQYQQGITFADAGETQALNSAETQFAQAEADAAYNEAVQTAAAVCQQTTAVSAANADETYRPRPRSNTSSSSARPCSWAASFPGRPP